MLYGDVFEDLKEINSIAFKEPKNVSEESFQAEQSPKESEPNSHYPQVSSIHAPRVESALPEVVLCAAEAVKENSPDWDMRPHVLDGITKKLLLLDSGSQVCAWPPDPGDKPVQSMMLKAANGTKMKCYGLKEVNVRINRKEYKVKAIKTEVKDPILGWNFTDTHKLTMDWTEYGDAVLIDKKAKISHILRYKAISHNQPQRLSTLKQEVDSRGEYVSSTPAAPSKPMPSHQVAFDAACVSALEEELDVVINDLEAMPESEFKELLKKFPDLLKLDFKTEDPKNGIIHRIDTGSHQPCKAKVRKLLSGSSKAVEGEKAVMQLLKLGIIERVDPSKPNHWSSALHLPGKSDGTLRPVGDYRLLNAKTILDLYPLPNLRSFTAKISGSTIFSKVDMTKAFHQILIHPDDRPKTCIATPWGLFNFRRLSMGLQNSAQSFQRLVDSVLAGVPNCFVYLDDILVFNDNMEDHLNTLETIFKRLNDAGLTLALSKCEFGKSSLDYLGYTVSKDGISPIEKKISVLQDFPVPTKQKQLLGFLGALNYYRSSLPCLPPIDEKSKERTPAEILDPLYKLATAELPKKTSFSEIWKFSKCVQEAFRDAKLLLQKAITLNFPDPAVPLALTTDASKVAMGATLDQFVDGSWRPLGMWSKMFNPAQQSYSTFRRELMSIQLAMRHFNADFNGRHLIIFSDHKPIINCFQNPDPQPHDAIALNAINEIGQWTHDVRFKAGREIKIADWLSRPPNCPIGAAYSREVSCVQTNQKLGGKIQNARDEYIKYVPPEQTIAALQAVALNFLDPKLLAESQTQCPDVIAHRAGNMPKNVAVAEVENWSGVKLFCEVSDPHNPRPLVPQVHRDLVINLLHHADHPGQKETLRRVSSEYYWPKLRKNVHDFVKTCKPCNLAKQSTTVNPGTGDFPVPDQRFSFIHLDIVGPLPPSQGYKYMLTIYDRCSRWTEAYPLVRDSSEEVCRGFMEWVARYGLPSVALSDNGNALVANLFQDVLKNFGVEVRFSPAYHPQTNGAIERKHQDIKNSLKAALVAMGDTHRENWVKALPWVMLGRRSSYQPNLDASAAQLVLGMSPRLPGQLLGHPGPPLSSAQTKALLDRLYKLADNPPIQTTTERKFLDIQNTEEATHVYVKVDKPASLCPKFEGPYRILSRPSRSQVQAKIGLTKSGENRANTYHWSSCKVAHLREGETEAQRPMLGRRPRSGPDAGHVPVWQAPSSQSSGQSSTNVPNPPFASSQNQSGGNINNHENAAGSSAVLPPVVEPANIQNENSRPVRKTRNKTPAYKT